MLARKPLKLVAVALASKMARAAWRMMPSGQPYDRPAPPARLTPRLRWSSLAEAAATPAAVFRGAPRPHPFVRPRRGPRPCKEEMVRSIDLRDAWKGPWNPLGSTPHP